MVDRDGFLTEASREFLRGEKEYSGKNARQMRYQRRRDIRESTRDALLDLKLLYKTLAPRDVEHIFADVREPDQADNMDHEELADSIAATLALLYWGLGSNPYSFGPHLKTAIHLHERWANERLVEVRFDVLEKSGEQWLDEITGKIERGEFARLSREEMRLFLEFLDVIEDVDLSSVKDQVGNARVGTTDEQADRIGSFSRIDDLDPHADNYYSVDEPGPWDGSDEE